MLKVRHYVIYPSFMITIMWFGIFITHCSVPSFQKYNKLRVGLLLVPYIKYKFDTLFQSLIFWMVKQFKVKISV